MMRCGGKAGDDDDDDDAELHSQGSRTKPKGH